MSEVKTQQEICALLAAYSGTSASDWHLLLRARSGMEFVFRAIKEVIGDGEVITTPYTCITAVNPIIVAGLKPIYADINPEYLSHTEIPKNLIHKNTRAIMMQHTLGIMGDKKQLRKQADDAKCLLIEDSAHCVTRMLKDGKKPIADISIHSFGVEKIIWNSKFGGAIYLNPELKKKNPKLYDAIVEKMHGLPEPPAAMAQRIKMYRKINGVLQHTGSLKPALRRIGINIKLFEAPVADCELEAKHRPNYAMNDYVANNVLSNLPALSDNYKMRLETCRILRENLASPHFKIVTQLDEPLLAFPIRFKDKKDWKRAYKILTRAGFYIRRWYDPLLYPGAKDRKLYSYDEKTTPEASLASQQVLCLPTNISRERARKMVQILNNYAPKA